MSHAMIKAAQKNESHLFNEDLKKGDYGEYLTKRYLHKFYHQQILNAEDKSNARPYQKADIDLVIQFKGREKAQGIEVKNDSTLYPNFFYEVVSVAKANKQHTPGCMLVTEADVLYYIYEALNVSIVVSSTKLRQWALEYVEAGKNTPIKTVYNKDYNAKGYALPIKAMMDTHSGIEGIKIVDLETNKTLTYEQFNNRRLTAKKQTAGQSYTETKEVENWQNDRTYFWSDANKLNVPLQPDEERYQTATYIMNKMLKNDLSA